MTQIIEQIRSASSVQKTDAFLIQSGINRRYVTGFTGTAGAVLITEKRAFFITDFRYTKQAEDQVKGFEIVEQKGLLLDTVASIIEEEGVKSIGFEKDHVTYTQFEQLQEKLSCELVPVSGLIEELRMKKSGQEIDVIQEAVDIADRAFDHIQAYIRPGAREIDISNELEFFMRREGAVSSSFDIIVASGWRSALPHGVASTKQIGQGELVTLDFGAYYQGYCSDITRTVAVGEPDSGLRSIYDTVHQAQLTCLEGLKPGITGIEADALARDYITEKGYGRYFGHSTGHGMGMEVHEGPGLSFRSSKKLEPGHVVTVEPGIYIEDTGGTRIEDDVVITEEGCRILSRSTKELLILE
ncbi:M24 family metallopeptidase [Alkalicoccus chagannorensis]|uniref:M24 family metallopeptidase n=1 Tax=Alkalicoccus chagannorensis TaxID=427072 RepID=UPI000400F082|nr:Xaa-Pro peptidase family protein [Alkalicoccus chagannorensis]